MRLVPSCGKSRRAAVVVVALLAAVGCELQSLTSAVKARSSQRIWIQGVDEPAGWRDSLSTSAAMDATIAWCTVQSGRRSLLSCLLPFYPSSMAAAIPAAAWAASDLPEQPTQEEQANLGLAFLKLQEGTAQSLGEAELAFSKAIARWQVLGRPQAETAQLLIARAKARIERNELAGGTLKPLLEGAVVDITEAVKLIRTDKMVPALLENGRAAFQEFPDALVRRGLANEGLGRWTAAVEDYSEAINLWGGEGNDFRPGEFSEGGRLGVNPFVMNYRGNALSRLGRYEDAVADYHVAAQQFSAIRDSKQLSVSLSNEALALYGAGAFEEASVKMKNVLRRDPKNVDMHAALAAVYWGEGRADLAETEWEFACNKSEEGCGRYKDFEWVRDVRRWPPALAEVLNRFLKGSKAAVSTAGG